MLFSGITVVIALLGMLIVPTNIFRSLGRRGDPRRASPRAGRLTLLPAVLSLLGDRINKLRIPFFGRGPGADDEGGFWARAARSVMAHPWPRCVVALAILLGLASPSLGSSLGFAGAEGLPRDTDAYRAFKILDEQFTPGAAPRPRWWSRRPTSRRRRCRRRSSASPRRWPRERRDAHPAAAGDDRGRRAAPRARSGADNTRRHPRGRAAGRLLRARSAESALLALRNDLVPGAFEGVGRAGLRRRPDGPAPTTSPRWSTSYTPCVFAFVLGLSFVLLLLVFRSIVVPIKAILMNLLSVGAAYGALVLVFQNGLGASFGLAQIPTIADLDSAVPVRDPVRSVDGLPRLPAEPDPRALRPDRRQHRLGGVRAALDGQHHHRRRGDHDASCSADSPSGA